MSDRDYTPSQEDLREIYETLGDILEHPKILFEEGPIRSSFFRGKSLKKIWSHNGSFVLESHDSDFFQVEYDSSKKRYSSRGVNVPEDFKGELGVLRELFL